MANTPAMNPAQVSKNFSWPTPLDLRDPVELFWLAEKYRGANALGNRSSSLFVAGPEGAVAVCVERLISPLTGAPQPGKIRVTCYFPRIARGGYREVKPRLQAFADIMRVDIAAISGKHRRWQMTCLLAGTMRNGLSFIRPQSDEEKPFGEVEPVARWLERVSTMTG